MKRLFFLLLFPVLVSAVELNVDKSAANSVTFISDAPLEAFEGVTENIDGYVAWHGDEMTDSSEFYFEVDLNSLDTGIGLRNRHMRESYLETDAYRFASYSGRISHVEKDSSGSLKITAVGTFNLHGVEKSLDLSVLAKKGADAFIVESHFVISLTDFDIKVPKLMFMKVDENMAVSVKVKLKTIASES